MRKSIHLLVVDLLMMLPKKYHSLFDMEAPDDTFLLADTREKIDRLIVDLQYKIYVIHGGKEELKQNKSHLEAAEFIKRILTL